MRAASPTRAASGVHQELMGSYGEKYCWAVWSAATILTDRYNEWQLVNVPIDKLFSLIDFSAVFVGALGGALAAVRDTRYKYDLVGVMGLAVTSALGGGI